MTIKEKEKILFEKLRKDNHAIVTDGIVDENEYLSSKYKILYVMKEVNGGKDWDLREFLYEGGRPQTWDNVARWTQGILNLDKEYSWEELLKDNEKRRETYLKKIGSINLKKTGGGHTSVDKEISKAAWENKEIIKNQIEVYNPDIIICCGTAEDFVKSALDPKEINWTMTQRGVKYIKDKEKIILSFAHPEARIRDAYLYYALVDAVREILGEGVVG
ncbi:hypothetical protein [uncultured Anaerococcus sp.]|uniref:hypothetical protein n=1 Tax=uncultured Anaerococcus sp. TaxID=293428 RepID=UPI00280ABCAB|nr:hypothetical protein [uncultured Anaerococcus sp.]